MNPIHSVLDDLQQFHDQAVRKIQDSGTLKELEDLRVLFLGKKGSLTTGFLKKLGQHPPEDRPVLGDSVNRVKEAIQESLHNRMAVLKIAEEKGFEDSLWVDVTLPGARRLIGMDHLIKRVQKEIEALFIGLGYGVKEGPEIEDVFHNFEALNTPQWHPVRDENDSFYLLPDEILLRTHTSPVQIRTMLKQSPPIAIIAPGRVYRSDYDATHLPAFHQVEGLLVDQDISVAHLIGTLEVFVRFMFGEEKKIRLRPSFFPFTEPSFEVDILWEDKSGKAVWLEIMGCGMVDPRVFEAVGYDSETFSGFAFGMGIERVTMLKYGLTDIRDLVRGDLRFSRQNR